LGKPISGEGFPSWDGANFFRGRLSQVGKLRTCLGFDVRNLGNGKPKTGGSKVAFFSSYFVLCYSKILKFLIGSIFFWKKLK